MLDNWLGSSIGQRVCYLRRVRFRNAHIPLQKPHSLLHPLDLTRVRDCPYVLGRVEIGFAVNPTPTFSPITSTSSVLAPSLRRISISPPFVSFGRQVFPLYIAS